MNERKWEKMMKEKAAACDRAEDLVAYLYGEASEHEAHEFLSHMERCHACREELAAFGSVREDVALWRNQSLPFFESPQQVARVFAARGEAEPKRSALVALREFFKLSPAWMRAATAAAALLVCALLVFAVARLYRQPETVVKVVQTGPTQSDIEAMVNKRAEELRRQERQADESSATEAPATPKDNVTAVAPKTLRRTRPSAAVARRQNNIAAPGKVNSSQEARQQLAELMQRTKEDDGIPRLSDLIDDSNEPY